MNKVVFVLLMLVPLTGFSAAAPQMNCSGDMPSTVFEMKSTQEDSKEVMKLRVKHFFGTDYAPIHSGVITANDIPYLAKKGEIIKKLGDEFVVDFQPERCEVFGEGIVNCYNSEKQKINGVAVSGTSFTTKTIETKVYDYTFKGHQVVFSFIFDSVMYEIPMNYSPEECLFKK